MKMDRRAVALEDDALEVVIQHSPHDALQRREGLDVPTHNTVERLIERKDGVNRARVRVRRVIKDAPSVGDRVHVIERIIVHPPSAQIAPSF